MRHTISVLVENKFGVLARIAGLFSARGYNIASLAVSETLNPQTSYMTIVVAAQDEKILEQIKKQLNKLIDVITITDFTKKEHVDRELVLVKVNYSTKDRAGLEAIFNKYIGKIIHHQDDTAIIEAVGDQAQIKSLLDELDKFGIIELTRTGKLAINKG
ncbi:MAG: acetolactate synthase small subunit [Candidatus Omnitrophica bacterium CG08_land_8_20_14_0_20_41_16]|uniref:Acetolactate synthase small subunit n=1 Tax=Candidatus Sherwoodlollariibacterium unditelluris TaxID=1974757 RepID=A0A2G9YK98_9BACT|nr:MAG: acetolactate synthase small subunit [Candidatus Omnitrophica bacterium CG23_combo_of_CG06-09_8_20_14_all_41_10]PIS33874.1 MAG: acetolactate synthase small subunit [Candidatus Omnitrophica bacterium CG08_land_8_20_14_0_20_41_16]